MENVIRFIIVASALLTATLLLFLGIRELSTKNGKHGLFITTLIAALSITGCNVSPKVDSPADSANFQAGQDNKAGTQNEAVQSERLAGLSETQEWSRFKAFWKKLDQVEPKKKEDNSIVGEYYGSITYDESENLRAELEKLIAGLKKLKRKKLVSSLEVELLGKICRKRIDYLHSGLQSMMTRMMPPPLLTDKENSISDLERHIDVLLELKKNGKIKSDEFQQALSIVKEDIKLYSILDTLSESYLGYYSLPLATIREEEGKTGRVENIVEKIIAGFEKDYAGFQAKAETAQQAQQAADTQKDIAAKYAETKKAVDKLKNVFPSLAELVSDLEK